VDAAADAWLVGGGRASLLVVVLMVLMVPGWCAAAPVWGEVVEFDCSGRENLDTGGFTVLGWLRGAVMRGGSGRAPIGVVVGLSSGGRRVCQLYGCCCLGFCGRAKVPEAVFKLRAALDGCHALGAVLSVWRVELRGVEPEVRSSAC
jgi:hypothetical protein